MGVPRHSAPLAVSAALVPAMLLTQAPGVASQPSATPEPPPMRIYLGTTHAHTGAYNTHGEDESTPADVFAAAAASGFDFFILTEHSGPSGPTAPAEFYDDARQTAADLTTATFAAVAGFEYSDNDGDGDTDHGHITSIGTDDFVNAMATDPVMDFTTYLSYLVEQDQSNVVVAGFNHPGPSGHGASRPGLLNPQTRRLMALSETYNHTDYRQGSEQRMYEGMISELDRGWRVAPTCALDSHGLSEVIAVETGDVKPCRTGILAPDLSPASVLEALLARRTFASSDLTLRMRYLANGSWMGSRLGSPAQVRFDIWARDPNVGRPADRIRRIDIVGSGGTVLASRRFDAHQVVWRPRVPSRQNRYMLVRVFTRDQPTPTLLAAPVWLR
jgi:hypothetical protein